MSNLLRLTETELKKLIINIILEQRNVYDGTLVGNNITINSGFLKNVGSTPQRIISLDDDNIITFPQIPTNDVGSLCTLPFTSLICRIGDNNLFLIVGQIGRLGNNNNITNQTPTGLLIYANPYELEKQKGKWRDDRGQNLYYGNPVKILVNYNNLGGNNFIDFTTQCLTALTTDYDSNLNFWKSTFKDSLFNTLRLSSRVGINNSMLNDNNFKTYARQVNKKFNLFDVDNDFTRYYG